MREPAWERIDALAIRAFEEVRVRPTFLPSALLRKPRTECGCQPGLVGKAVNQMPIFRDVREEPSIRYGKRRVEEGRLAGTYWQPAVSLPSSSNRTCPFRASLCFNRRSASMTAVQLRIQFS